MLQKPRNLLDKQPEPFGIILEMGIIEINQTKAWLEYSNLKKLQKHSNIGLFQAKKKKVEKNSLKEGIFKNEA